MLLNMNHAHTTTVVFLSVQVDTMAAWLYKGDQLLTTTGREVNALLEMAADLTHSSVQTDRMNVPTIQHHYHTLTTHRYNLQRY